MNVKLYTYWYSQEFGFEKHKLDCKILLNLILIVYRFLLDHFTKNNPKSKYS